MFVDALFVPIIARRTLGVAPPLRVRDPRWQARQCGGNDDPHRAAYASAATAAVIGSIGHFHRSFSPLRSLLNKPSASREISGRCASAAAVGAVGACHAAGLVALPIERGPARVAEAVGAIGSGRAQCGLVARFRPVSVAAPRVAWQPGAQAVLRCVPGVAAAGCRCPVARLSDALISGLSAPLSARMGSAYMNRVYAMRFRDYHGCVRSSIPLPLGACGRAPGHAPRIGCGTTSETSRVRGSRAAVAIREGGAASVGCRRPAGGVAAASKRARGFLVRPVGVDEIVPPGPLVRGPLPDHLHAFDCFSPLMRV